MAEPSRGRAAAARLQAVAAQLIAEARCLPAEVIHWIPGDGVWSVMDNLCHVREFVPFWTGETLRMVRTPHEPWGRDHHDTARLAAVADTSRLALSDVLSDLEAAVQAAATVLNGLSDANLTTEAESRNSRWAVKPASFVVDDLLVGHVAKHRDQIRRNARQFAARSGVAPLLFAAPPQPLVPVRGRAEAVPLGRIFCVGRNYEAHAREMGVAVDREAPFYFTKSTQHYVPSGATVAYPPGTSNLHYEMELVVVIGRPAFKVAADRALDCVFGYACGLDMTRRDLQLAARAQRRPWDLGKDFEESAVISTITPAESGGHPASGAIELRVNGDLRQQADLSQLIHDVAAVIAHLSSFYHLQPGDVIFTGTPEGVGPVQLGDRLHGRIAGVGEINLVIGAP